MLEFHQIKQLQDLWNDLPEFEAKLQYMAKELGLSLQQFQMDHISVRCHHMETALRWHEGLIQCAELISDNEINGRPIRLYEVAQPIQVAGQQISIFELPFPKNKIYPLESWEHVEMVINVAPDKLEMAARELLPERLPQGYSVKMSQPKGQLERLPNPTLAVTNDVITIKYHPFSLKNIIDSEK